MPWMNAPATSDTAVSRIGWFLHHKLRGQVDKTSDRTGISTATLRRYMEHDAEKVAGGAGPQRMPILFRLLAAMEINPARLAAAVHYAHDAPTFWRLIHSKLCIEHAISLQVGAGSPLEIERKVIPLDELAAHAVQAADGQSRRSMRASVDRLQIKLAGFLGERLRGHVQEIHSSTGIAKTTLRRYSDPKGTSHGGAGPQSVRAFYEILRALDVNPAKLLVACYYSSDDYSFRLLMSSSLCIEDTLQFSTPGEGHRIERKLHNLDVAVTAAVVSSPQGGGAAA